MWAHMNKVKGPKFFWFCYFSLGVFEDDVYGLSLPGTFPLLWYKGWSPGGPITFVSQCDDVSRDDIITFRPFPWAGAHIASPHEDWSRMF